MLAIISDLDHYTYRKGWPKWAFVIVPFLYITTWPVICYRYQNWVHRKVKIPVIRQLLIILGLFCKLIVVGVTGVTISEKTSIGKGLFISHVGAIVVGNGSVIGEYCSLHQGVTIGGAGIGDDYGKPKIGNNVFIGVGAVIAGKILIGDNVAIGANAVVIKDVPSNVTVGGVPSKVISDKGSFGMIHYRGNI